jgi:hypothetical protein
MRIMLKTKRHISTSITIYPSPNNGARCIRQREDIFTDEIAALICMTVQCPFLPIVFHDCHYCPWLSMISHDCTLLHMTAHECPWLSMTVHDCPWLPMTAHDCPWLTIVFHGCPWVHDFQWLHITTHDFPWFSVPVQCPGLPNAHDCKMYMYCTWSHIPNYYL